MRWLAASTAAAFATLAGALCALPAQASLDVCNETASRVGVAVGYHDGRTWISEGWWHLDGRQCGPVIESALNARFYYLFVIDFDAGGGWSGLSTLCVAPGEFTIEGRDGCETRGHHTAGFFEVDTGRAPDWTVQLDATSRKPYPRTDLGRLLAPLGGRPE